MPTLAWACFIDRKHGHACVNHVTSPSPLTKGGLRGVCFKLLSLSQSAKHLPQPLLGKEGRREVGRAIARRKPRFWDESSSATLPSQAPR